VGDDLSISCGGQKKGYVPSITSVAIDSSGKTRYYSTTSSSSLPPDGNLSGDSLLDLISGKFNRSHHTTSPTS
jgi:hypothetical protein